MIQTLGVWDRVQGPHLDYEQRTKATEIDSEVEFLAEIIQSTFCKHVFEAEEVGGDGKCDHHESALSEEIESRSVGRLSDHVAHRFERRHVFLPLHEQRLIEQFGGPKGTRVCCTGRASC